MIDNPYVFDVSASDFQAAVIERSAQVPVLVDFWAQWCGPCRALAPVLVEIVDGYQGQLLLAKVDTDAEQALAREHGIRSLPTVRLYRDGQAVAEFMGVRPASQILALLAPHIPRASDAAAGTADELVAQGKLDDALTALAEARNADPANERIQRKLIEVLLLMGHFDRAEDLLASLPAEAGDEAWTKGVKARLMFAAIAKDAPARETLASKVATDPSDYSARHALSARFALEGNMEAAMDGLLGLMKANRAYGDDAGRKGLLAIFDLLGTDHPLVGQYRQKLASALY